VLHGQRTTTRGCRQRRLRCAHAFKIEKVRRVRGRIRERAHIRASLRADRDVVQPGIRLGSKERPLQVLSEVDPTGWAAGAGVDAKRHLLCMSEGRGEQTSHQRNDNRADGA
jgi:hypothetical protein